MSNLTKISTVQAEITSNGQLIVSKQIIKDLYIKGNRRVKIEIFSEHADAAPNEKIDTSLAENIKDVQGIPIAVALNFIKSKGALKNYYIRNDF